MFYREIFSSKVLMMQPNIYGTNIFWWCSKKKKELSLYAVSNKDGLLSRCLFSLRAASQILEILYLVECYIN